MILFAKPVALFKEMAYLFSAGRKIGLGSAWLFWLWCCYLSGRDNLTVQVSHILFTAHYLYLFKTKIQEFITFYFSYSKGNENP